MKKQFRKMAVIALCLIMPACGIQAQGILDKGKDLIKQGKDALDGITSLVSSYKKLKEQVTNSTDSYNKNAVVAKGNVGSNNTNPEKIRPGKLNKLKFKDGTFVNLTWDPKTFFDGQLFPSAIVSMASYTGEMNNTIESISRPVGFSLYSTDNNVPIKWEIEAVDKNFFDKISGTYMYKESKKYTYLAPPIPWKYENLIANSGTKPIGIYFRIFDEDGNKLEKLITVSVRSINDCIYYYQQQNMQFMFSAFVQEENKEIDNILRKALDTKMIQQFVGYQSDMDEVDNQIAAIWRVLHERGFTYSSITNTTGDSGDVHSQAVRTMDNALKTNQANCVDGTVVFASILKKIGIDPIMVLVPGHCFLGYYVDQDHKNIKFLETTALSNKYINKVNVLAKAKSSKDKNKAYRQLFDYAQTYAFSEYKKDQANANLIDVSSYRKIIKPIPSY